ncbi:UNVERIFIED_CONTAM: Transglutaminase-like enzymes, putative cysteine proteases [Acetivibrio alkalicellulosi]
MNLVIEDNKIDNYLKNTEIIDYKNEILLGFAEKLTKDIPDNTMKIKTLFEYVRDKIKHSFDIGANNVTFKASEVFKERHGVCYAKSHLLAAFLRSIGVPSGFCYQGLLFDDINDRRIVLHGLVGVYVEKVDKWIRLDARGNKTGVDAQFSLTDEKLAYPVRKEFGEFDTNIIYSEPSIAIQSCLLSSKDKKELVLNLPGKVD